MTHKQPGDHPVVKESMTKWRKVATIFALSLALAIIILDTTLLNVSLAAIIREFKTDIQSIQWVITVYSLTLAALTITGGRIGDLFGRKKMFVVGAIIFGIGSFISSISWNVPVMILGESVIEGVGAALMMPATASLLISNFKGRDRAVAFGIWGGIAGAAAALGPIIGGFLTTNYTWRWGFRLNVGVCLILCLMSFLIPESHDTEEKPTIDWTGVILSSLGLLSFVFGVIESSTYGWWTTTTPFEMGQVMVTFPFGLSIVPFALVIGLFLLVLFVLWELHEDRVGSTPLVSMKLFKNRQFTSGAVTTAVLSLGQSGIIFAVPVFLQAVRGYDALQTGMSLLPMSLSLLVVSPLAAFLSGKIKPKWLIHLGLLINALASVFLYFNLSPDSTSWSLAPGMAMFGIGMGLVMSQINNLTLSAVSMQEAGEASGVNNTLRQVGSTFGSAVIGAVLIGALTTNLTTGIKTSPIIPSVLKERIAQGVSSQASNVEFGGGAQFATQLPNVITQEIKKISQQATVDADKQALVLGTIIAFLGLAFSFAIPDVKKMERGQSLAGGH